ncbi:hypothetical protein VPH5P1C_0014 [Vibrio phage 5P1c]
MPIILGKGTGTGGSGGGGASIAEDMYFPTTALRDTFTTDNPSRIYQGVTCAVENGTNYDYYQYDETGSQWRDANLIFQGRKGVDGRGITETTIEGNDLTLYYTDGTEANVGKVVGDNGIDVTSATIEENGHLQIGLSDGSNIDAGRARGKDGDLVYELLDVTAYGDFFSTEWSLKGTNIYGVTGLGGQFNNAPYVLNASTTYAFEILLVNEDNQYSMRITSMSNADFDNSGRESVLAGNTKTAAESIGWKTLAFTSDAGHADPADGFDLKPNASIGMDSTSAVMIKNNAGNYHNAIDQDINLDAIRLGSPSMRTYLRTNEDRMQIQTTKGMKTIAHTEDLVTQIPSRSAIWVREPEYNVSSEQLQTEIFLMCQPQVGIDEVKATTVVLPSKSVFENQFYIPDVSDISLKGKLPHIESFQFETFLDYFSSDDLANKLTLISSGNWLPFVSRDTLDEKQGIYLYRQPNSRVDSKLHTFAFMKPVNPNPDVGVWGGYVFQSVHPQDWNPNGELRPEETSLQDARNLTYTNAPSGELYVGVDRQIPVITTDFSTSNFALLRIKSDGVSSLPRVEGVSPPMVASGFSYITNGQPVLSNSTILQVASGVYSFAESGIDSGTPIGSSLYVQANGLVGTAATRYICGWVVEGGVVIDVDMYNASVRSDGYSTHFTATLTESTLAGQAVTNVSDVYIKKYNNTDKALNGITLRSGVNGQSVPVGYKGVFESDNLTSFVGSLKGELVVIDSSTQRLNWAADSPLDSVVVGWYVGQGKFWIDCDMYNRYKDIERYAGSGGTLPTDPSFNSVTTPDILSNTNITFHISGKDYVLGDTNLDLAGSKITNIADATENTEAATLRQVLANTGVKNNDSNTNLEGYLTMFSANDGSTIKSALHTPADIAKLKADVLTNGDNIVGLDSLISDVETSVTTNTTDITNLGIKTDRIAGFNILNQVDEYTQVGVTDTLLADNLGDRSAQALLFYNGMINGNPDYVNYKLIHTVPIANDLFGFLPSDKGGNLVVDNSRVTVDLFKYTKFTFTDNDGDTYSTAVNANGEFKEWRRLDSLPIAYDITELGITPQELVDLNGNKLEIAKKLYDGLFFKGGRWKLLIYDNSGFYGLTSEFNTNGVLEVESLILDLKDTNGNTLSQITRLKFTYDTEYVSSNKPSKRVTSLFDRNQSVFEWSDPVKEAEGVSQRLTNLETLSNEFYKDHTLTYTNDLLTTTVITQGGDSISRSVTIVAGSGENVPETFDVYVGWENTNSLTESDILAFDVTKGKKSISSSKAGLLIEEFQTNRSASGYLYSYIAYPKGAVSPDPYKVEYIQGQPATWGSYEVVINNMTYIVLQPEWANDVTTISMTLVQ